MEKDNKIDYQIINDYVAVITLPHIVVSGEDAMDFSNIINQLVMKDISIIVIDLSQVDVMNSTGLGMIAGTHNNLNKTNKKLYIINVNERIYKLFQTTHLNKVLNIETNLSNILK
jgi:anti-sigma B factor antagonist